MNPNNILYAGLLAAIFLIMWIFMGNADCAATTGAPCGMTLYNCISGGDGPDSCPEGTPGCAREHRELNASGNAGYFPLNLTEITDFMYTLRKNGS